MRETNNTPKTVPEEPVKQESNTQYVFPLSMAEMLSLAQLCKKMGGKAALINFLQLLPE